MALPRAMEGACDHASGDHALSCLGCEVLGYCQAAVPVIFGGL